MPYFQITCFDSIMCRFFRTDNHRRVHFTVLQKNLHWRKLNLFFKVICTRKPFQFHCLFIKTVIVVLDFLPFLQQVLEWPHLCSWSLNLSRLVVLQTIAAQKRTQCRYGNLLVKLIPHCFSELNWLTGCFAKVWTPGLVSVAVLLANYWTAFANSLLFMRNCLNTPSERQNGIFLSKIVLLIIRMVKPVVPISHA